MGTMLVGLFKRAHEGDGTFVLGLRNGIELVISRGFAVVGDDAGTRAQITHIDSLRTGELPRGSVEIRLEAIEWIAEVAP